MYTSTELRKKVVDAKTKEAKDDSDVRQILRKLEARLMGWDYEVSVEILAEDMLEGVQTKLSFLGYQVSFDADQKKYIVQPGTGKVEYA